jgi:CHASE3 domain sensor protein
MNFRFTIGKKIASGFGILIILTMIVFITTYDTLERSRTTSDRISSVNTPSVKALQELNF